MGGALSTERLLHELWKENGCARQPLASLQLKLQPFPSRAFVPAVSGYPLVSRLPRKLEGATLGGLGGSRLTCRGLTLCFQQLGL